MFHNFFSIVPFRKISRTNLVHSDAGIIQPKDEPKPVIKIDPGKSARGATVVDSLNFDGKHGDVRFGRKVG